MMTPATMRGKFTCVLSLRDWARYASNYKTRRITVSHVLKKRGRGSTREKYRCCDRFLR